MARADHSDASTRSESTVDGPAGALAATSSRVPNIPAELDQLIGWFAGAERGLEQSVRRRMRRRHWVGDGRAHIEVRGARDPDNAAFSRALEATLRELDGVNAADINGILGRVVVAFDADQVSPAKILDVVEAVEETHGRHIDAFPTELPEHPADIEPLRRQLLAVGTEVVGAGVATVRRSLGLAGLPPDVAPLLSLIESTPRLRRALERHLGPAATDLVLAITGAGAQALSQGPFGLLVDAARRTGLAAEAAAARRVWQRREPELYGAHRGNGVSAVTVDERPCPLPPGPLERYADATGAASLAASALALLVSGKHDRAATVLADVSPKPAGACREAFAAWLGVSLSAHGVVPLDNQALRRLDRLDTVVLGAEALAGGDLEIVGATGPDGRALRPARERDVLTRARALFDFTAPTADRAATGWTLSAVRPVRDPTPRTPLRLELAYRGRAVAVVTAAQGPHALAGDVVAAAHKVGHVVLVGDAGLAHRLGLTAILPGGQPLVAHIRRMQREGPVVGLVVARGDAALRAADCGLGLVADRGRVPWGAHLLCGGLEPVVRILDAVPSARLVSRRGDVISAWGSGVGALLAAAGPARSATTRALYAVNAATAAAVALGAWSSAELARRTVPVR